jgi:two-component system sensor kinase FixL
MNRLRYVRDAAIFAPCYIALDWASYIDPVGPFNITPWNPQAGLAIVWLALGGLGHAPAVLVSALIADMTVRSLPGGWVIALLTASALAAGYSGIAWALRTLLDETALRTTRQLTIFVGVSVAGAAVLGAGYIGVLETAGLLPRTSFGNAWLRFWIGDAVGILVTAPLLLAATDPDRRAKLAPLTGSLEAIAHALVLGFTVWIIFEGLGTDPSRHFYLLFLPLIWTAIRFGMNGAILATAIVQLGVVIGIHGDESMPMPVVELQALMTALTLTGLFLGVMVDQRERAEQGLRRSLRLAAAGEMAGAIAHEVNQPLTALTNYGRSAQVLLDAGPSEKARVHAVIGSMLAEADRAAEVVRRLRDFFRMGTTRLEPVDLESILASAERIAKAAVGQRPIRLEISSSSRCPALHVDRLQVEVVLRNLLVNAVESLEAHPVRDGLIRIVAEAQGDTLVRLTIADNGPGIAAANRDSLFEPFTSGKPTGMGMGLAVSRAIAEAHGGNLEALSVGHGEFHLTLPCIRNV